MLPNGDGRKSRNRRAGIVSPEQRQQGNATSGTHLLTADNEDACGKCNYAVSSDSDSLRVVFSNDRQGRCREEPPIRSSASSPSGFQFENGRKVDSAFSSAIKNGGVSDEEESEHWPLLDESSEDAKSLLSRPSSSNQELERRSAECLSIQRSNFGRAESESLLRRHRMAASQTSPDEVGALLESKNRRSFHHGSLTVCAGTIPRRHSGTANSRNSISSARINADVDRTSFDHRLSQPAQLKSTLCTLAMVSPTSVSQQWLRNSTGNCLSAMPTSTMASHHPQPDPNPNLLSVFDHRASTPLPGAVSGGGAGIQNPLYNVSNEFMRVAGYSQQFKRLLSKRDGSEQKRSIDLPGVNFAGDGVKEKDLEKGVFASPVVGGGGHEFNEQAALAAAAVAMAPATGVDGAMDASAVDLRNLDPNRTSRKSAYGRLWKEQPNFKHRLKKRKILFAQRTKVSDFALLFALAGIVLTIFESELSASGVIAKTDYASLMFRALIVGTTVILLGLIVWYHAIETKIAVIDSGAEDWRVAITYDRLWQCALEVAVCSICPFPGNVSVTWDRLKSDHRTPYSVAVPLDAVLSVPMFLRAYLFGRFMALHSRQFQDAATRSIAALNHIAVNFTFVLKTLMHEHPLRVLVLFTVAFWVAMSWVLTQCERYVSVKVEPEQSENNHYLNSVWFIIITFMSIGYGDIVPNTYCGRALAITTGIVGAGVSSALIAVISRKLELSRAEKHVNQFMTDSKLTRQRKEAAAAVLQHTWFIHKYKNIPKAKDDMKLRMHQRRFLAAINEFRRVKWDQRKLAEQGNALVDVAKLQNDMHETLWDMQQNQDHLVAQMGALMQKMQELQDIIVSQSQQSPNRAALGPVTRQSAIRPASPTEPMQPQFATPIVIAQHVDSFEDGNVSSSFDDENGHVVIL